MLETTLTQKIVSVYISLRSSGLSKSEKYNRIQQDLKIQKKQRPMIRRAVNDYLKLMKEEAI